MNALATGILLFLLWDVISKASEPITTALNAAKHGHTNSFVQLLVIFAVGFALGLLGLVYFERRMIRPTADGRKTGEATASQLSVMIASGIGLHNFSEGLAMGGASRSGAIALATVLIIGFGLHNMTEGFGIAAPLAGGPKPSWSFLLLLGLAGGGPTFLGTAVGFTATSDIAFVLFLALAAGSIFYVVGELLNVGRRYGKREVSMFGVYAGFMLGFCTDLILTWSGA